MADAYAIEGRGCMRAASVDPAGGGAFCGGPCGYRPNGWGLASGARGRGDRARRFFCRVHAITKGLGFGWLEGYPDSLAPHRT